MAQRLIQRRTNLRCPLVGARVRILGVAWNVVEVQGKWHSLLVVRKRGRKEREMVSGRTEGKGKEEEGVFLSFLKIQAPLFLLHSPKKGKPFLDSS